MGPTFAPLGAQPDERTKARYNMDRRESMRDSAALGGTDTQDIILYASKKALFFLFIGCLTFVLLCGWMYSAPRNIVDSIISIVGIAFFGLGVLIAVTLFMRSLFSREPLLIIDEDGMTYHYPLYTRMKLKWEDITQIDILTYSSGRRHHTFFVVTVTNAKKSIILSQQNGLSRFFLLRSPGVICSPSWLLPISAEKLAAEVQRKYAHQIQQWNIQV